MSAFWPENARFVTADETVMPVTTDTCRIEMSRWSELAARPAAQGLRQSRVGKAQLVGDLPGRMAILPHLPGAQDVRVRERRQVPVRIVLRPDDRRRVRQPLPGPASNRLPKGICRYFQATRNCSYGFPFERAKASVYEGEASAVRPKCRRAP